MVPRAEFDAAMRARDREFIAERRARDREFEAYKREQDAARLLAANSIEGRLEHLNDLRVQVVQDRGDYIRADRYAAEARIKNDRIAALERWQSRATGMGAVLGLLAGAAGAAIARVFGW